MFEKGKREQRHEQEDAAFNRMLLWLLGAVVAELLIMLIKQLYVDPFLAGTAVAIALLNFFHVFCFLGAALTAAAIVWAVLNYRKGKSPVAPCICAAAAAGLWVLSVLGYNLYDVGMNIMMLLPAVAAVLIVVYFLYQRVFFLNSLLTAGGLLALWLHRQYYMEHPTMIRMMFAAGFVLLAAALVLSFLLRNGGGKLGRQLRVLPADTGYLMTWLTCGITALAMALTLVLGAAAGFYLLFALVAWEFVQAVFYTVRLM